MPLQAVLLGHHEVIALKLGHLDLPRPRDARASSVHINVNLVAGVRGGDPHVLPGVDSTYYRRGCSTWVADSQCVCGIVDQRLDAHGVTRLGTRTDSHATPSADVRREVASIRPPWKVTWICPQWRLRWCVLERECLAAGWVSDFGTCGACQTQKSKAL